MFIATNPGEPLSANPSRDTARLQWEGAKAAGRTQLTWDDFSRFTAIPAASEMDLMTVEVVDITAPHGMSAGHRSAPRTVKMWRDDTPMGRGWTIYDTPDRGSGDRREFTRVPCLFPRLAWSPRA